MSKKTKRPFRSASKEANTFFDLTQLWLGILALIVSVIAAFFAWQSNIVSQKANELLQEQIRDDLIVSSVSYYGGDIVSEATPFVEAWQNPGYLYCSHKVRLSNNGGSAATIINFSTSATYATSIVQLEGYGEAVAFPNNEYPFEALPIKSMQSVMISEAMFKSKPINTSWVGDYDTGIALPLSVEPHSSTDFIVHNIIGFDLEKMNDNFAMIFGTGEQVSDPMPGQETDSQPILMTYSFDTTSGQHISTDPLQCWQAVLYTH